MTLNDADRSYLGGIQDATREVLRRVIGDATAVAIVDAPNQRNVGDALIWLGELDYLRSLGLKIEYVADLWSYDARALRKAMPKGVILLHGGGNFGDLWIGHQILREIVATDFPDYKIVQLPQSIHFEDTRRAMLADDVLGNHPDLTVLVRESQSHERAEQYLPNVSVEFCYDMALGWTPSRIPDRDERGLLAIARADREASSSLDAVDQGWILGQHLTVTDWGPRGMSSLTWHGARSLTRVHRFYARARRKLPYLPLNVPDKFGTWALARTNSANVSGAIDLYSRARVIVTDRLHAHVLAALLGKPHVVLDNSYGKVSGIFEQYTGQFSTASYAADLDTARTLAASLVD
ncbi:polysaccharide pyruvyl transferase family protein [Microbacterium jejuense]|uniref:Polysaccharide pyruvyl transferase family protein n=1 Tax=Microbacterium jejuense TaxID=1263637 RepID=A0ABS7HMG9_9MICO|nr:polysaccharide pyruvyl transferase family protein [Microbacterium jejuense]MBW9094147.1 polysaccharide pyruvyl transferase family protein [Microbacterium jejuense]